MACPQERACLQAEAQAEARGLDPKDAQLEFFGLPVRALEIPALIARMRILSRKARCFPQLAHQNPPAAFHLHQAPAYAAAGLRNMAHACADGSTWAQIAAATDPPRHFRVDSLGVPAAKWCKTCGWNAKDDAMLLLGIHWCVPPLAARRACPA